MTDTKKLESSVQPKALPFYFKPNALSLGILLSISTAIVGLVGYSLSLIEDEEKLNFYEKEQVTIQGKVINATYGKEECGNPLRHQTCSTYSFSLPGDSIEDVIKKPITVRVLNSGYYTDYEEKAKKEDVKNWVEKGTCVNIQARKVAPDIYKALAHQIKPCSLDDKLYEKEQ